ncbi:MAG: flippase [Thermoleophilia bacterium]|nr:flippase [Thermoleophilia bacterium]
MISRREVLKHSGYLLSARLFARLASVPFLIYVAASLGPSLFGVFSFVLATVEMISSLSDLGMSRYGARAIVRMKQGRERMAGMILTFQVATSVLLSGLALLFILALAPEQPKLNVALLGLAGIFFSAFIFTTETIFTGFRRFGASATLAVLGRLAYVALGVLVLALGYSVTAVMMAFVAGMAVESVLRMGYTLARVTSFSLRFGASEFKEVAVGTLPFAVTAIAILVFYRADMIIMGALRGDRDVGIYSAAYSFFSFFMWFPIVLSRALLPGLTSRFLENPRDAEQSSWFWYRAVGIVGIPISFTMTMLARPLFETLLPAAYEGSIITLQILMWAIPPLMMVSLGFIALTVTDREKQGARTTLVTAALIVALDLVLIRLFGPVGAAAAMVSATAVWIVQVQWLLRKHVFAPHHGLLLTFTLPVSGGVAMALSALLAMPLGGVVSLAAGLSVYAAVILGGRQIERRLVSRPAGAA